MFSDPCLSLSLSLYRSPAAGGHVQLLVSRAVGAFRFLCHVWLRRAELSAGREEEVDAVVTETRVRSSQDAGQTQVIQIVDTVVWF